MWILYGFSVGWVYTSLFPGQALDLEWQWLEWVFPTKGKQEIRLQGQGSGGYLLDQRDRQHWVVHPGHHVFKEQTKMVCSLKQPMVPKGMCFPCVWAAYLSAIGEREAVLSPLEVGAILQEHGLSQILCLAPLPQEMGMSVCGEKQGQC